MRVTFIIPDLRKKSAITKWRGPLGTPEEKQAACIWALTNMQHTTKFEARTEADELFGRAALRNCLRADDWPPIDCQRRKGYWLLSTELTETRTLNRSVEDDTSQK